MPNLAVTSSLSFTFFWMVDRRWVGRGEGDGKTDIEGNAYDSRMGGKSGAIKSRFLWTS
jgi:hypothetical protein